MSRKDARRYLHNRAIGLISRPPCVIRCVVYCLVSGQCLGRGWWWKGCGHWLPVPGKSRSQVPANILSPPAPPGQHTGTIHCTLYPTSHSQLSGSQARASQQARHRTFNSLWGKPKKRPKVSTPILQLLIIKMKGSSCPNITRGPQTLYSLSKIKYKSLKSGYKTLLTANLVRH